MEFSEIRKWFTDNFGEFEKIEFDNYTIMCNPTTPASSGWRAYQSYKIDDCRVSFNIIEKDRKDLDWKQKSAISRGLISMKNLTKEKLQKKVDKMCKAADEIIERNRAIQKSNNDHLNNAILQVKELFPDNDFTVSRFKTNYEVRNLNGKLIFEFMLINNEICNVKVCFRGDIEETKNLIHEKINRSL